jgi:imidazolonepropionase-like amidohydrolase
LGIDEFVGSIEEGKDADLVILSGDPLKAATWVEKTLVGGEVVYEREKDERLRLLFEPEKDAN